jgi:GTPase SAR1 family protein
LPQLEDLNVRGQPIETPPPEVVAQGVEAIKNYWRQQKETGVDYLCEAKLLIVGEAGAGKTSLAKKIVNKRYALTPSEPSTEGIEVLRWSFPTAIRISQSDGERMLNTNLGVNIWDFGGQEIYHATHQSF